MRTAVWYGNGLLGLARGDLPLATASLKAMLTTSAYVPNQDTHVYRSDVTNETAGTGYVAGGQSLTGVVLSWDGALNEVHVTWDPLLWVPPTSFVVRNAVIYRARGGAASADELLFFVPYGFDITAGDAGFKLNFIAPVLALATTSG